MKFKFTWGHGVIIALACFIIFICSMVFSIEFSNNSFDLVTDDYYEQEINYQQEIDASKRTAELKEKPYIQTTGKGVEIFFPKEFSFLNTRGSFVLFRPNSKDLDINKKELEFTPQNSILIPRNVLVKGAYILKLYWEKDKLKYQIEIPVVWN